MVPDIHLKHEKQLAKKRVQFQAQTEGVQVVVPRKPPCPKWPDLPRLWVPWSSSRLGMPRSGRLGLQGLNFLSGQRHNPNSLPALAPLARQSLVMQKTIQNIAKHHSSFCRFPWTSWVEIGGLRTLLNN